MRKFWIIWWVLFVGLLRCQMGTVSKVMNTKLMFCKDATNIKMNQQLLFANVKNI